MRPNFIPREVFRAYMAGTVLNKYLRVGGIQAYSYIVRSEREGRPLPYKMRSGSRIYRLLDVVARARAEALELAPPKPKKDETTIELEALRVEYAKLQMELHDLREAGNAVPLSSPADKNNIKAATGISPFQPLRNDKAAIYMVDGVSVDVTDLLNTDFDVLDVMSNAMTRLSIHLNGISAEARTLHLSRVFTRVMDLLSDRVLALNTRLTDAYSIKEPPPGPDIKPEIAEQCNRLNRLGDQAATNDYIALHTGGHDNFSAMNLLDLNKIIPSDKWQELQIRLRARQMLTPANVTKVARWVARGLNVSHAVVKIQVDNEVYATDGRNASRNNR